jgi:dTDP-4-amino-4,6-dideoxygalactose transaminase
MLEMQAVIGRIQLKRMSEWTRIREKNASRIEAQLSQFEAVRVPRMAWKDAQHSAGSTHANYKCYAYVKAECLLAGWTRDKIIEAINAQNVPCYQGSCSEVYLEKAFQSAGLVPEVRLRVAHDLGESSLMFLVHPTLTDAEIDQTCRVIDDVMSQASLKSA